MNDERRTPPWLFQKLHEAFQFNIDAAASRSNALLPRYWTIEDDALSQEWAGTIWCNPPYSRGEIVKWVTKAAKSPRATSLLLLPGDCSTVAGQLTLKRASAVLFVRCRLKFEGDNPAEKSAAKFCNWLALFHGSRWNRMRLRNLDLGVVL